MSVGESLARARAERGLSVDDIAAATRIRATLIRGIEADDFAGCGGDVYARGHIRSIAGVLGVDAAPLIEEYDAAHGGPPVPLATAALDEPAPAARGPRGPGGPRAPRERRPRRPNWAAASVVALLVICAAAAAELVTGNASGSGAKVSTAPPARVSASRSPGGSASPKASPPANSLAELPANEVTVLLRVTGASASWVSVTSSAGATIFQGLLQPGQSQRWTDPTSLSLVIGNAPVVDLVVNAHDIGAPPSQNDVARLTFTRTDFTGGTG